MCCRYVPVLMPLSSARADGTGGHQGEPWGVSSLSSSCLAVCSRGICSSGLRDRSLTQPVSQSVANDLKANYVVVAVVIIRIQ